jgi:hypothetical protein
MITRCFVVAILLTAGSLLTHESAFAQSSVNPQDLGIVEAPVAGSVNIPLGLVPLHIRHTAQVAIKQFAGGGTLTSGQLDKDDVLGLYEIAGVTMDGKLFEVDVRPDGVVEELEIEIGAGEVPAAVREALATFAPGFTAATGRPLIEKSVRPSAIGLSEIWYEFSGVTFDVEVRSDGRAVLIEPA